MQTQLKKLFTKKFWILQGKRLFQRNREHVGIKTCYNLYKLRPILRRLSKGVFLEDENQLFSKWLEELKSKEYKKVLLLGNAPCLNELTQETFNRLRADGYLTIGLNRSIYAFQTDILIWSDLLTIDDILKKRAVKSNATTVLHVRHERNHQFKAAEDPSFQSLHQYWNKHKNFSEWPKSKLFMFSNCAVGALHLSWKLGIKDVLMVGFGFDNREYFYKTNKYKKATSYEVFSDEVLTKNCGGYDTQRMIKEVLEYLTTDENFKIYYNGDSKFLKTIPTLKNIKLNELDY